MNNPKFGKYSQKMYKKREKNTFWIAELLNHDGKKNAKTQNQTKQSSQKMSRTTKNIAGYRKCQDCTIKYNMMSSSCCCCK